MCGLTPSLNNKKGNGGDPLDIVLRAGLVFINKCTHSHMHPDANVSRRPLYSKVLIKVTISAQNYSSEVKTELLVAIPGAFSGKVMFWAAARVAQPE